MTLRTSLLPLVLFSLVGCGGAQFSYKRSAQAQRFETVAIRVFCPGMTEGTFLRGTGVIISKDKVLTAAHVVPCLNGDVRVLQIGLPDPHAIGMKVDVVYEGIDVARLSIVGDDRLILAFPVSIGRAFRGDRVCFLAAIPSVKYQCGFVEDTEDDEIVSSTQVELGNSGSGLYNAAGRLVGIVIMQRSTEDGKIVVGSVSRTLAGREWLLK